MVTYSLEQRMACVNAFSRAQRQPAAAADILMREDPFFSKMNKKAVKQVIKFQVKKAETKLTVAGQYASRPAPNPKKVPDDVALRAAKILKEGYYENITLTFGKRVSGLRPTEEREVKQYFTSIQSACQLHKGLRGVCKEYGVTPHHLLRRMHDVDKGLCRRRRDFKRAL
jgi:hypothetical protein